MNNNVIFSKFVPFLHLKIDTTLTFNAGKHTGRINFSTVLELEPFYLKLWQNNIIVQLDCIFLLPIKS